MYFGDNKLTCKLYNFVETLKIIVKMQTLKKCSPFNGLPFLSFVLPCVILPNVFGPSPFHWFSVGNKTIRNVSISNGMFSRILVFLQFVK